MNESKEVNNIEFDNGGYSYLKGFLTSEEQSNLSNLSNVSLALNDTITNRYLLNIIERILDKNTESEYPFIHGLVEMYKYNKNPQIRLRLRYENKNIKSKNSKLIANLLIGVPCRITCTINKTNNIRLAFNVRNNDVLLISPYSDYTSDPELKMYKIYIHYFCEGINDFKYGELRFTYTPKINIQVFKDEFESMLNDLFEDEDNQS